MYKITLFLGELESIGSSAANKAEDTMMHTRMTFPKWEWLQNQWQNTRNLYKI